MPIKYYNPTTPGSRQMTSLTNHVDKCKPEKSLLLPLPGKAGRNCTGRITVRHRGGRVKRKYRVVDFKRNKGGIAQVLSIEYDPNRTGNIALIQYEDGVKKYILAPLGLKKGDRVESGDHVDIIQGNAIKIRHVPVGTSIYNIELRPGAGACLVRSAGSSAQLMAKDGKYAQVRLPSTEVRLVPLDCSVTIGQVSNLDHENVSIGKAGRNRRKGIRPTVRGVAMNPCDHPHGGGEGKSPIGRPSPVTPWGKPTLGYKTRSKKNRTNKFIIRRRKRRSE